ncbi:carboxymuconolactone decarboxylase family protein [Salmonella enterica]|uniref:carboxymuconolactone decarboxylase family protein n=1 Tax=Salmonella enterica TaxID=28901 RepID=UPI001E445F78|nr:carboxymuconolactone decarboxylase family protein [Salmonella enterica]
MHVDAAVKHGATREEIAEALSVAIKTNTGAALTYTARYQDRHIAFWRHKRRAKDPALNWLMAQLKTATLRS